jgi:dTDP-4-amino-4,6-dideoxy-D-galactose acyltransferase
MGQPLSIGAAASVAALEWDSEFFGFPVARVDWHGPDEAALDAALALCGDRGVRCAYLLLPADDLVGAEHAQARSFRLCDVRTELDRPLVASDAAGVEGNCAIGPVAPWQIAALEQLAALEFPGSRFYADPRFERERCRELYVAFLHRGLCGVAGRQVLSEASGKGFIVFCLDRRRRVGRLELLAVAESTKGSGLGKALIGAAHKEFARAGLDSTEVVTQASNVTAQRLYQRDGYRTRNYALWFHRWFW